MAGRRAAVVVRRGHVVRRLRARPGHRVPGRQAAGVRQLAGETGQAERGRRHRDHRQEARRPGRGPVQAAVAGGRRQERPAAGQHVPGPGHRRVLRHAHPEDIAAVDTGRRHRPGTGPTRYPCDIITLQRSVKHTVLTWQRVSVWVSYPIGGGGGDFPPARGKFGFS